MNETQERIVNICDYENMVEAVCKPMGSMVMDFLHSAVGVVGEVAELVEAANKIGTWKEDFMPRFPEHREPLLEELGDALFYITKALLMLNKTGSDALAGSPPSLLRDNECSGSVGFLVFSGHYLDLIKKSWAYNEPLDLEKIQQTVFNVYRVLVDVASEWDFTIADLKLANMQKLGKRYPNFVYSDKAAQQRADKAPGE